MSDLLKQAREMRAVMFVQFSDEEDEGLRRCHAFLDAVIEHLEKCRHVLPSGLSFPNQQHQQRTHTLALIAAVLYAPDLNRPAQDVVADAEELLAEVEKRAK